MKVRKEAERQNERRRTRDTETDRKTEIERLNDSQMSGRETE